MTKIITPDLNVLPKKDDTGYFELLLKKQAVYDKIRKLKVGDHIKVKTVRGLSFKDNKAGYDPYDIIVEGIYNNFIRFRLFFDTRAGNSTYTESFTVGSLICGDSYFEVVR